VDIDPDNNLLKKEQVMFREKSGDMTQTQSQSSPTPQAQDQTGPGDWHKPEVIDLEVTETYGGSSVM
jgi:hypothetical protein